MFSLFKLNNEWTHFDTYIHITHSETVSLLLFSFFFFNYVFNISNNKPFCFRIKNKDKIYNTQFRNDNLFIWKMFSTYWEYLASVYAKGLYCIAKYFVFLCLFVYLVCSGFVLFLFFEIRYTNFVYFFFLPRFLVWRSQTKTFLRALLIDIHFFFIIYKFAARICFFSLKTNTNICNNLSVGCLVSCITRE